RPKSTGSDATSMATPEVGNVQLRKATRDGEKRNSKRTKKCKYLVQVFGCGYRGKKMKLCPKHKHDLLPKLCHVLRLPEEVPFHMEIYDEEWKEFVDVDLIRLPDEATLRVRFGESEENTKVSGAVKRLSKKRYMTLMHRFLMYCIFRPDVLHVFPYVQRKSIL
ncbi:unnamed protein product, partial [Darwinula stevensoni]